MAESDKAQLDDLVVLNCEVSFTNLIDVINEIRHKINKQSQVLSIFNKRLRDQDDEMQALQKHNFTQRGQIDTLTEEMKNAYKTIYDLQEKTQKRELEWKERYTQQREQQAQELNMLENMLTSRLDSQVAKLGQSISNVDASRNEAAKQSAAMMEAFQAKMQQQQQQFAEKTAVLTQQMEQYKKQAEESQKAAQEEILRQQEKMLAEAEQKRKEEAMLAEAERKQNEKAAETPEEEKTQMAAKTEDQPTETAVKSEPSAPTDPTADSNTNATTAATAKDTTADPSAGGEPADSATASTSGPPIHVDSVSGPVTVTGPITLVQEQLDVLLAQLATMIPAPVAAPVEIPPREREPPRRTSTLSNGEHAVPLRTDKKVLEQMREFEREIEDKEARVKWCEEWIDKMNVGLVADRRTTARTTKLVQSLEKVVLPFSGQLEMLQTQLKSTVSIEDFNTAVADQKEATTDLNKKYEGKVNELNTSAEKLDQTMKKVLKELHTVKKIQALNVQTYDDMRNSIQRTEGLSDKVAFVLERSRLQEGRITKAEEQVHVVARGRDRLDKVTLEQSQEINDNRKAIKDLAARIAGQRNILDQAKDLHSQKADIEEVRKKADKDELKKNWDQLKSVKNTLTEFLIQYRKAVDRLATKDFCNEQNKFLNEKLSFAEKHADSALRKFSVEVRQLFSNMIHDSSSDSGSKTAAARVHFRCITCGNLANGMSGPQSEKLAKQASLKLPAYGAHHHTHHHLPNDESKKKASGDRVLWASPSNPPGIQIPLYSADGGIYKGRTEEDLKQGALPGGALQVPPHQSHQHSFAQTARVSSRLRAGPDDFSRTQPLGHSIREVDEEGDGREGSMGNRHDHTRWSGSIDGAGGQALSRRSSRGSFTQFVDTSLKRGHEPRPPPQTSPFM